jgi:hypothetical protein
MNFCLFCINTVRSESWGRESACRSWVAAAWSPSAIHRSRPIGTADLQWSGWSSKWRWAYCYWHSVSKIKFNKKLWEELITCFPLIWNGLHRKRLIQKLFYCCMCIRCHGSVFTEPLPSNDKGLHIQHTDWWEWFMKYATEMGSGAIIYIPSFIKLGSGIQKLIGGGGDTLTQWQLGDLINLLLFFQKKESRLKIDCNKRRYNVQNINCSNNFSEES